jgi:ribosomal-protein-alanine N-acetyltransferase
MRKQTITNWVWNLRENKEVIGSICAINNNEEVKSCGLGYQISKRYRNKGYTTEALIRVLKFLIEEIGYNRIQGGHFSDNPASGRVMEKAGMKYEGTLRQNCRNKDGVPVDSKIYGLIKDDITGKSA